MSPDSVTRRRLSKYSFPEVSRASMLMNAKCEEVPLGLVHVTTAFAVKGRPGFGGTYMFSAPGFAATSGCSPGGRVFAYGSWERRGDAEKRATASRAHETRWRIMVYLQN
jgi:hypothetical protein